jgi:allantoinase
MATSPAKLVGLKTKGELDIGGSADFVAYAPEESFQVHASELQHKNAVSAFDGRTLYGVAKTVWLRGAAVSIEPGAVASGHLLSR